MRNLFTSPEADAYTERRKQKRAASVVKQLFLTEYMVGLLCWDVFQYLKQVVPNSLYGADEQTLVR